MMLQSLLLAACMFVACCGQNEFSAGDGASEQMQMKAAKTVR